MSVETKAHIDDDKLIVARTQDVGPILERAKAQHNSGQYWSEDRELVHAASLPNVLIEDYCNKHGITFAEWMHNEDHQRRMLNDPDLSAFRTWKGRI